MYNMFVILAAFVVVVVSAKEKSDVITIEVESKAGDDVNLQCTSDERSDITSVQWQMDGKALEESSRFVFEKYNELNFTLKIDKVDYADRNTYRCIAERKPNENGTTMAATTDIILRVRDPLGALWPFIGVVVEAIVLFIFLTVHGYTSNKSVIKQD